MPLRGWLWIALTVVGCTSSPAPEQQDSASPNPAPPQVLTSVSGPADAAAIEVRVRASAWGAAGPVPVDGPRVTAVWLLEVEAATDHTGLELTSVSFFDPTGKPLPDGLDVELRSAGPSDTDFARSSTSDFDGHLEAQTPARLWVAARIPNSAADAARPNAPRFRITLTSEQSAIIRISGPLGPEWPSA